MLFNAQKIAGTVVLNHHLVFGRVDAQMCAFVWPSSLKGIGELPTYLSQLVKTVSVGFYHEL